MNGKVDVVRILLESGANVGAQNKVRNQMMMIMMISIIIVLNTMMIWLEMIEDNDDKRSMLFMMAMNYLHIFTIFIMNYHFFKLFNFHVSSLHCYYRMDKQVSCGPAGRVT